MRIFSVSVAVAAAALAMVSTSESARADLLGCRFDPGMAKMLEQERQEQFLHVQNSRHTNKGKGNGGELVFFGIVCLSDLEGEEEVDIDANDCDGIIATDPGNSNQDGGCLLNGGLN